MMVYLIFADKDICKFSTNNEEDREKTKYFCEEINPAQGQKRKEGTELGGIYKES